MHRRSFLTNLPLAAAAAISLPNTAQAAAASGAGPASGNAGPATGAGPASAQKAGQLRFNPQGRFRILVFSDLHYGPEHDPESHALIADMIRTEDPDFILVNGDCIMGGDAKNMLQLQDAVDQVITPLEKAGRPWAVTLGNHDREHFPHTGLSDEAFFAMFEAAPHNINAGWEAGITGIGNTNLLVWNADGSKAQFNIWLMDSGKGTDDKSLHYEWVRHDQIDWYLRTEARLSQRFGTLPALLFCHIPVREFITLGEDGDFHGRRGEHEEPSRINSGLFAALEERKDVLGIFCGHDHKNNYVGMHRDIALGFDGTAGLHNAYPFYRVDDPRNGKLRGGRVFEIGANDPATVKTWIRHMDGTREWVMKLRRQA